MKNLLLNNISVALIFVMGDKMLAHQLPIYFVAVVTPSGMLECLGYMLAIANEWDLAIPGLGVATVVSNGNSNGNGNNVSAEDAQLELVTQKKRRQENLRVMDGIMGL